MVVYTNIPTIHIECTENGYVINVTKGSGIIDTYSAISISGIYHVLCEIFREEE